MGRMLVGDEPPLFLLEIAVRMVIIYGYTLLLIRWIGSRSIAQLSLVEFLLVIALGSAVGDAMFYPDVPLLHCIALITVVVLLDKALSYAVARNARLEDAIEGKSIEVVRDGLIHCPALESMNFGHDELFEQLRLRSVEQLGEVKAAYLETNGMISVFKEPDEKVRRGLSIEPPWDVREPPQVRAGDRVAMAGHLACSRCATVIEPPAGAPAPSCARCEGRVWHAAAQRGRVSAKSSD
jgi:uncharacterized membrane protein YcaP (DUF421 family)